MMSQPIPILNGWTLTNSESLKMLTCWQAEYQASWYTNQQPAANWLQRRVRRPAVTGPGPLWFDGPSCPILRPKTLREILWTIRHDNSHGYSHNYSWSTIIYHHQPFTTESSHSSHSTKNDGKGCPNSSQLRGCALRGCASYAACPVNRCPKWAPGWIDLPGTTAAACRRLLGGNGGNSCARALQRCSSWTSEQLAELWPGVTAVEQLI